MLECGIINGCTSDNLGTVMEKERSHQLAGQKSPTNTSSSPGRMASLRSNIYGMGSLRKGVPRYGQPVKINTEESMEIDPMEIHRSDTSVRLEIVKVGSLI